MTELTRLWSVWQGLPNLLARAFTQVGTRRFAEWASVLALNVEQHISIQSVLAIERPGEWKALESFAATTMRAHNWVVVGALLEYPGKPSWFRRSPGGSISARRSCPPGRASPASGRSPAPSAS